jgi:ankyrin repeat protein
MKPNTPFKFRLAVLTIACGAQGVSASTDYIREVRPVLARKCFVCHGVVQQVGGLRLDAKVQRQAVAGGAESEFVRRITSTDPSIRMPPWPTALGVSPQEVKILKAWAGEGAPGSDPVPVETATANLLAAIDGDDTAKVRLMLKDRKLVNAPDSEGSSPLMHATLNGDLNILKLLLQRGADPNVRNYDGATALLWAVDDLAKVKLLLDAGADVNAKTKHGSTALLAACLRFGSGAITAELLKHGADVAVMDSEDLTPLLRAAMSGDTETMKQLLAVGANPNPPAALLTALTAAVWFGNSDAVKLLLARRVPVNAKDAFGFTPLSFAALWGRREIAAELLDNGADVNLPIAGTLFMRRSPGTPLMLAAYAESQDVDLMRLLIARGADVHFATAEGEFASSRAAAKGDTPVLKALLGAGAKQPPPHVPAAARPPLDSSPNRPLPDIHTAVERSLVLLQRGDAGFFNRTGCKSCHNQSLPAMALGLAEERGFRFDRDDAHRRTAVVAEAMKSQREEMLQMMEDEGPPLSGGYALAGLAAMGYAPDDTTAAFVRNIAARQLSAGNWHPLGARPPIEYSDFSTTAFAIHAIRLYGRGRRSHQYEAAIGLGRKWLLTATPRYTDERVFQMLGLHWSGTKSPAMSGLVAALLNQQRSDGGWSQLSGLASDAYATGQALYALNQAGGMSTEDSAYQRGVKFLRETQMQDGSWFVESHAIPIQPPLDAGFPHGTNQFISATGTSWAAMALMLTAHPQVR